MGLDVDVATGAYPFFGRRSSNIGISNATVTVDSYRAPGEERTQSAHWSCVAIREQAVETADLSQQHQGYVPVFPVELARPTMGDDIALSGIGPAAPVWEREPEFPYCGSGPRCDKPPRVGPDPGAPSLRSQLGAKPDSAGSTLGPRCLALPS